MSVESQTEVVQRLDETERAVRPEDVELEEGLRQISADISRGGRVDEARAAVKELIARWPDDKRVQHWARVLAPPVTIPITGPDPRAHPFDRERAWLRAHAREHPGCWLAVFEDRLVAAHPDLEVVLTESRRQLGDVGAVIWWQPDDPENK